ncbi:MAG: hypothetical protein [Cressdnaviricota sp.]|nr:MAG: hypothetical protein [Cressdnaviricota sp.]
MAGFRKSRKPRRGVTMGKKSIDAIQSKDIAILKKKVKSIKPKVLTPAAVIANSSIIYSSPYILGLNPLSLGTGETNRVGSKAKMEYLKMGLAFQSTADLGNKGSVRVLIVQQKQNRGNTTVLLDGSHSADTYGLGLFNNYASGSSAYNNTNWLFNETIDFSNLYKIIYDTNFYLDVGTHGLTHVIKINKKLGFVTDYSYDNDGDMEDILYNGLYLIVLVDSINASVISLRTDYMLTFTDA